MATYTANNLPNFLKTTDEFKDGDLKECLKNGFLQFDQLLISDEVHLLCKHEFWEQYLPPFRCLVCLAVLLTVRNL